MKKMKLIGGIMAALIAMPIWFYLLYQILVRVEASELMWFLYWIFVPASFVMSMISRLTED